MEHSDISVTKPSSRFVFCFLFLVIVPTSQNVRRAASENNNTLCTLPNLVSFNLTAMRPEQQGSLASTVRLDGEVTFAKGNISGQQLCVSKLFSRHALHQGPQETKCSQITGQTSGTTEI